MGGAGRDAGASGVVFRLLSETFAMEEGLD